MRYEVTTDRSRMDIDRVYHNLNAEAYWPKGIPRALFDRAMANALCFAGLLGGEHIAFCRVISDYATFANLVDVYVERPFRGNGYATGLLDTVFAHPDLQSLRRFTLATRDAHALYEKFGFHRPLLPETLMERYDPDMYLR